MGGLKNSLKIFHKHANLKYKNVEIDIDLHPFSWIDIIKLLLGNEFGILPDSFLLIVRRIGMTKPPVKLGVSKNS